MTNVVSDAQRLANAQNARLPGPCAAFAKRRGRIIKLITDRKILGEEIAPRLS